MPDIKLIQNASKKPKTLWKIISYQSNVSNTLEIETFKEPNEYT